VQFDVDVGGGGLAGESFDQGVGHDLISAAPVPVGLSRVGVSAECGQAGDSLFDGEVTGQYGHGVRRWAEPDPAMPPLGPSALEVAVRVGCVGIPAGAGRRPPGPIRSIPAATIV
jgi:hypothetical protein